MITEGQTNNPESKAEEQVLAFYRSIDGKDILTTDGKIVKTILKNNKKSGLARLEFQDYPGMSMENLLSGTQNYIGFEVYPEKRIIELEYASLGDSDLASNGVFEGSLKLIEENFPQDFKLTAAFIHPTAERQAMALKEKIDSGLITTSQAETNLLRHPLIRNAIKAGFNKFILYFKPNLDQDRDDEDSSEYFIKVAAEKSSQQKDVTIEILK